jgi:hypothetical protein
MCPQGKTYNPCPEDCGGEVVILKDLISKISLIYPQDITYNPCTDGSEGVIILKDLISRTFNNIDQNRYLNIFTGCVLDNGRRERGVSRYRITFNY